MARDPQSEYDALCAELTATTASKTSKMFGMPCLKTLQSGKAYTGYSQGAMVFKLSAPEHHQALALSGAHLFDPMGGRPMKEWVEVGVEHASAWRDLARAALRYVNGEGEGTPIEHGG